MVSAFSSPLPFTDAILVPAGHPVRVTDCDLALPCAPQAVCPFTVTDPPVYPVLNCNVIDELSDAAAVIVVKFGFVHLYTTAARCEVLATGTTAVKVALLPIQKLYEPVLDVIEDGVGGRYCSVTDFALPAMPQALCPLALIAPPVKPAS